MLGSALSSHFVPAVLPSRRSAAPDERVDVPRPVGVVPHVILRVLHHRTDGRRAVGAGREHRVADAIVDGAQRRGGVVAGELDERPLPRRSARVARAVLVDVLGERRRVDGTGGGPAVLRLGGAAALPPVEVAPQAGHSPGRVVRGAGPTGLRLGRRVERHEAEACLITERVEDAEAIGREVGRGAAADRAERGTAPLAPAEVREAPRRPGVGPRRVLRERVGADGAVVGERAVVIEAVRRVVGILTAEAVLVLKVGGRAIDRDHAVVLDVAAEDLERGDPAVVRRDGRDRARRHRRAVVLHGERAVGHALHRARGVEQDEDVGERRGDVGLGARPRSDDEQGSSAREPHEPRRTRRAEASQNASSLLLVPGFARHVYLVVARGMHCLLES